MLEKPNIPDEAIIFHLQEEYGLSVTALTFLPLGADSRTAVYRVTADRAYFLKLRKNFDKVIVLVPLFLKESGLQEILVPYKTKSGRRWADFDEYRLMLYPFIQGKDGFERDLADQHKRILGSAFRAIHTLRLPMDLKMSIRSETFSPEWREEMRSFLKQVEGKTFDDPTADRLANFIGTKQIEILRLIERAEQLAFQLQSNPWEQVLCHSDIHGGNILISDIGELYIVDWDDPILAPRERDLMFIGGGIDEIWKSDHDVALFYEGYGAAEINLPALAYYRYERVIEDLVVICEQLLSSNAGGADRERSLGWFTSNFESGQTIEIADNTYKLL
jgi:spectinomycin phosphotransferase